MLNTLQTKNPENQAYSSLEFSSHPGKYIKFTVQVIETMLNKFFDEMN